MKNIDKIEKIFERFDKEFGMPGFEHETNRIKDFFRKELSALIEEERKVITEYILEELDFAEQDKEMAEDPTDPKVRIDYFRDLIKNLQKK